MSKPIEEWRKKKGEVRKQNKQFLKRLGRKKGKQLDALAENVHDEVFSEVDCLQCANCCTSIPPIVNQTDAKRIAKHLGMKLSKFQDEYLTIDEDGDMVMRTTPCVFLQEDNYCLIYEYRPKACREYPHTNNLEFSKHLKLHEKNARYCPGVFHILERLKKLELG